MLQMTSHLQTQPLTNKTPPILGIPVSRPSFLLTKPISAVKTASFARIASAHLRISTSDAPLIRIPGAHLLNSLKIKVTPTRNSAPNLAHLPLPFLAISSVAFPSFAAEAEATSDKINIEAIVIGIDDFFNRYPFFVAGVTFIWLVVIPLTEEFLKRYKPISAIDAFRKLRDDPNVQLLDIRKEQSLKYLATPNLKYLNKSAVQVEFSEGREEEFVERVLKNFEDPGNTVICVLDNFDGDSLKAAELLFKNGFKETYAIKGGLRGKEGWQAIQETLLPPPMHVYPNKKKSKMSEKNKEDRLNGQPQFSASIQQDRNLNSENGYVMPSGSAPVAKSSERPLSPYPNYEDLKPPSSPTPSKPQ